MPARRVRKATTEMVLSYIWPWWRLWTLARAYQTTTFTTSVNPTMTICGRLLKRASACRRRCHHLRGCVLPCYGRLNGPACRHLITTTIQRDAKLLYGFGPTGSIQTGFNQQLGLSRRPQPVPAFLSTPCSHLRPSQYAVKLTLPRYTVHTFRGHLRLRLCWTVTLTNKK